MNRSMARPRLLAGAALASVAMVLTSCATVRAPDRPDVVSLGRNPSGEPCVASRDWSDPAVPDPFARAYTITCRGVTASRPVGSIRIVPATAAAIKPIDAVLDCGPATSVTIAAGAVQVSRCNDRALGTATVRIDRPVGQTMLIADAPPSLLGQLEEAVAILAGTKKPSADAMRPISSTIDLTQIVPGRATSAVASTTTTQGVFDPTAALGEGIGFNHRGLHVEASRVLNDALSRVSTTADPAMRVELLLEAGLADSNIRFNDSAKEHFDEADAIMAASPANRSLFLSRKRDAYRALDLINRHAFREAAEMLGQSTGAAVAARDPLLDPATLRQLNQPRSNPADAVSAIAVPDTADLAQLVLDIQAKWALSVARLALGDDAGARVAIDAAARSYRPLENERINPSQILWLSSRIERQRARLLARAGKSGAALDAFDSALDNLKRGALATGGTGAEPAIAQAELERASLFARTGAPRTAVRTEYAEAIDAMIDADVDTLATSNGMEEYLDLLVQEAATKPQADTVARFFRAVQATGEPAIARQVSQLQTVVTADPATGALVRERGELEREVTRLRYAISAKASDVAVPGAKTPSSDLGAARAVAEQRLLDVEAKLASDPRYRTVDEQPVTIEALRAALKPGEVFLKLTTLNRRIYGMMVSADQTYIYAVAADAASKQAIDALASRVRGSIDGALSQGKLVPFDDAAAYALFRLIAGPAEPVLASARALVVDPSGPLERLPAGVLVKRYDKAAVRETPFDFSRTAFLAADTAISTALSPRSFLVARALPPSRARNPFLGFGQHRPTAFGPAAAGRMIKVGFGCTVGAGQLGTLSQAIKPISDHELTVAADALGVPGAPRITGAAFSDTGVEARGDLDQYEVLHFATHGLEEGQWGCAMSPPALVTSFGDAESDGLLSFSEIAGLHLDANLVVLSACDTASGVRDQELARRSGQEESGSTLEGLVRAFLTANARSVLATYWQVSAERESEEFIKVFYGAARTKTIGRALQDAQRDLIRQPTYSHPFYWAPYFLVGEGSKTMLSQPMGQPLSQPTRPPIVNAQR